MGKKNFKKTNSNKTDNPFNIKINRKKHSVLGERVKGTQGLPVVSHGISHAKRKFLLFKQRLQNRKANRFVDKRLLDSSMPADERATFRFVKERQKRLKKAIFNLNDEEDLTHKGKPLLENFKDDGSGSEDEEQLEANYVKEAHFGGFGSDSRNDAPKSRKEIIDELIMESKKKKQERKYEKEVNADLTEKLDQEWKQILGLMSGVQGETQQSKPEKKDSYDVIMQELKFESRGAPSNRLKTPEEIARLEQERLQKLEKEREIRMVDSGESRNVSEKDQFSADSIYDGFELEFIPALENDCELSDVDKSCDTEDDSDDSMYNSDKIESEPRKLNNSNNECIPLHEDDDVRIPESMDDFVVLVNNCTSKDLPGIIECLIKGNLPCKSEKKLCKLETLFSIIIEYLLECCNHPRKNVEISGELFPPLYALAGASPVKTAHKFLFLLDQEQKLFERSKGRGKKKHFPRLQALLLLKLSTVLYSVSDFRHPVATPAVLFMCDILSTTYCVSFENIISRLFVSRTVLNCILISKRLVPEALNFLNKILRFAVNDKNRSKSFTKKWEKFNIVPSVTPPLNEIEKLSLQQSDKTASIESKKMSILSELISQLCKFATLYEDIISYAELFSPTLKLCSELPCDKYPICLKEAVNQLTQIIELNSARPLKSLVFINLKPKPLKLFEPSFDSKYTNKKNDIPRKRRLIKQVSQKIKKEEKGRLREMRRDMQVIASVKLNEKLEADEERKRKVKKLYQELAMQEGEYKKFAKKV